MITDARRAGFQVAAALRESAHPDDLALAAQEVAAAGVPSVVLALAGVVNKLIDRCADQADLPPDDLFQAIQFGLATADDIGST